jgi:hypothetical protein
MRAYEPHTYWVRRNVSESPRRNGTGPGTVYLSSTHAPINNLPVQQYPTSVYRAGGMRIFTVHHDTLSCPVIGIVCNIIMLRISNLSYVVRQSVVHYDKYVQYKWILYYKVHVHISIALKTTAMMNKITVVTLA